MSAAWRASCLARAFAKARDGSNAEDVTCLLLDTYSLFYRAFHALPPMNTASAKPISRKVQKRAARLTEGQSGVS